MVILYQDKIKTKIRRKGRLEEVANGGKYGKNKF